MYINTSNKTIENDAWPSWLKEINDGHVDELYNPLSSEDYDKMLNYMKDEISKITAVPKKYKKRSTSKSNTTNYDLLI